MLSPYKKDNLILNLSFQFALDIIEYSKLLESNRKYTMAKQLFNSGTSIHANVKESQNAESKADFIHKMKIAAKEAEETEGWLFLCEYSNSYPKPGKLIDNLTSILKILNKIIGSSKS